MHGGCHYTAEDEKKGDEEIDELERKIKAARYVNSALRQESEELDIAQAQLENFSKQLDGMQEAFRECGGVKQCIVSMHEKAEEVHHLIAEGINAGTFQVQSLTADESSSDTKTKKIKLK